MTNHYKLFPYKNENGTERLQLNEEQLSRYYDYQTLGDKIAELTEGNNSSNKEKVKVIYKQKKAWEKEYQNLSKLLPKYCDIRYTDEYLKANPTISKYRLPRNIPIRCHWANLHNDKIDTVVIIEGFKKAEALSKFLKDSNITNVRVIHISGILSFDLGKHRDIINYLNTHKICQVVYFYDNDLFNISNNNNKRINNFKTSFINAFNSVFNTCKYKPKAYLWYLQNKTIKAIDDYINAINSNSKATSKQLEIDLKTVINTGKSNDTICSVEVKKSKIDTLAKELFYSDLQDFYKRNKDKLNTVFQYNGKEYVYNNSIAIRNIERIELDYIINRYLGEYKGDIIQKLERHNIMSITAPTGTGKTTVSQDIIRHFGKGVIMFPTLSIMEQQIHTLRNKGVSLGVIDGTVNNAFELDAVHENRLILCTYDAITKIRDLHDRVLIIDEWHLVIQSINFRPCVIDIYKALSNSKKTVLLSATPNYEFLQYHKIKNLNFGLSAPPSLKINFVGLQGNTKNDKVKQSIIDQYKQDKINVIYYNNIEQLEVLEKNFKKQKVNVEVLTSKDKGQTFDEITANNTTALNYGDVLLTTSVIREGVNINDKDINIIIVEANYKDTIQFLSRFRQMLGANTLKATIIRKQRKSLSLDFEKKLDEFFKDSSVFAKEVIKYLQKNPDQSQNFIEQLSNKEFYRKNLLTYLDTWEISENVLQFFYSFEENELNGSNEDYLGYLAQSFDCNFNQDKKEIELSNLVQEIEAEHKEVLEIEIKKLKDSLVVNCSDEIELSRPLRNNKKAITLKRHASKYEKEKITEIDKMDFLELKEDERRVYIRRAEILNDSIQTVIYKNIRNEIIKKTAYTKGNIDCDNVINISSRFGLGYIFPTKKKAEAIKTMQILFGIDGVKVTKKRYTNRSGYWFKICPQIDVKNTQLLIKNKPKLENKKTHSKTLINNQLAIEF